MKLEMTSLMDWSNTTVHTDILKKQVIKHKGFMFFASSREKQNFFMRLEV